MDTALYKNLPFLLYNIKQNYDTECTSQIAQHDTECIQRYTRHNVYNTMQTGHYGNDKDTHGTIHDIT